MFLWGDISAVTGGSQSDEMRCLTVCGCTEPAGRPSEASPEGEVEDSGSENLSHTQGPGSAVDAEVTEPPDSAHALCPVIQQRDSPMTE